MAYYSYQTELIVVYRIGFYLTLMCAQKPYLPDAWFMYVQMLISTRIAREARVKTEGHKFLQRNRALEEDEEFMARATAGDYLHIGDEAYHIPYTGFTSKSIITSMVTQSYRFYFIIFYPSF